MTTAQKFSSRDVAGYAHLYSTLREWTSIRDIMTRYKITHAAVDRWLTEFTQLFPVRYRQGNGTTRPLDKRVKLSNPLPEMPVFPTSDQYRVRVYAMMDAAGLTSLHLAKRMRVPTCTIRNRLNGKSLHVHPERWHEMARALGYSPSLLSSPIMTEDARLLLTILNESRPHGPLAYRRLDALVVEGWARWVDRASKLVAITDDGRYALVHMPPLTRPGCEPTETAVDRSVDAIAASTWFAGLSGQALIHSLTSDWISLRDLSEQCVLGETALYARLDVFRSTYPTEERKGEVYNGPLDVEIRRVGKHAEVVNA